MKLFLKKNILLIVALVIAAIFRLWQLNTVPPAPSVDEVSTVYNAYSLLKTGKDEYGEFLPIIFRSYDDYKPPLFTYLNVPAVALFGVHFIAPRVVSILFSIVAVWATYELVIELFRNRANKTDTTNKRMGRYIALLAAFFLAISPWHIYISRVGFEIGMGGALLIFAIVCFIKKKVRSTGLFFAMGFMSYQAEKVILPVFLLGLLIIFSKELIKEWKKWIPGAIIFCILMAPFLVRSLQPESLTRFSGTSIFAAEQDKFIQSAIARAEAIKKGGIIGRILNDRRLVALSLVSRQYVSHFKPQWLVTNSGQEPHKIPYLGVLYWWEATLAIIGAIAVIRMKMVDRKHKLLLFMWFFSSPVAASITTGAPHATRSFTFLPTWQVFAAFGTIWIWQQLKVLPSVRKPLLIGFFGVISISLYSLWQHYFYTFPQEQSQSFQYAASHAMPFVLLQSDQYDKIVISNKDNLYQSYMHFLYHSKYNPMRYHGLGGTGSGGYAEAHVIDKYEFRPIHWKSEVRSAKTLFVGNPEDFPPDTPSHDFYSLDGSVGIRIVPSL